MSDAEEKVTEVLSGKITQLEEEIEELRNKVGVVENFANYGWLLHREVSMEENKDLPLPRLEMRFEQHADYGFAMVYGIVRKPYVGDIEFIPISKTTTSGCRDEVFKRLKGAISKGDYETIDNQLPFRDGVHIKYDSMSLGMPIVIRCEECTYLFSVSEQSKTFINNAVNERMSKGERND